MTETQIPQETFFCRVLRGIEWIAADELHSFGLPLKPVISDRTLFFRAPKASVENAIHLQTVDDLFRHLVTHADFGRTKDSLRQSLAFWESLDWSRLLEDPLTPRGTGAPLSFTVSASFNGRRNFTRFEMEDTLGAAITNNSGYAYTAHRTAPHDFPGNSLRVHFDGKLAFIGVRIAPMPLHRRAWKVRAAPGTLHPPLAAAMSHFVSQERPLTVVAPFCGRGTILVELALRTGSLHQLVGFDLAADAVEDARANAASASASVRFDHCDARSLPLNDHAADLIVTNPPWGGQVPIQPEHELLPGFVKEAARVLNERGCAIVLHKWESALADELSRSGFGIIHEPSPHSPSPPAVGTGIAVPGRSLSAAFSMPGSAASAARRLRPLIG